MNIYQKLPNVLTYSKKFKIFQQANNNQKIKEYTSSVQIQKFNLVFFHFVLSIESINPKIQIITCIWMNSEHKHQFITSNYSKNHN